LSAQAFFHHRDYPPAATMSASSTGIPRPLQTFAPSAIILDMDGLMVDSEPLWFEVERAFARDRGGDWTDAHAAACVGRGLAATLEAMGVAFGFASNAARDSAAIIDAFIANVGRLELKPGCLALLDHAAAAGIPLAVASSSPLRLIDAVLARFGIAPRFRAVVSGESVARAKPAPDIFLRAAAELGVPPARCAVIEDSIAGVTAGHAAGMFVIAVPEGSPEGRGFEAVADTVVGDLFEALRCIHLPALSEFHRKTGRQEDS
jgi:HAD superfamily hydrolase (TIGR01509 family)